MNQKELSDLIYDFMKYEDYNPFSRGFADALAKEIKKIMRRKNEEN